MVPQLKQLYSFDDNNLPFGRQSLSFHCDFTDVSLFVLGPNQWSGTRPFTGIKGIFLQCSTDCTVTLRVNGTGQNFNVALTAGGAIWLPLYCLWSDLVLLSANSGVVDAMLVNFDVTPFKL